MSLHDSMCRAAQMIDGVCIQCELIALVREDERERVLRNAPPSVFVKAFKDGRASGYAVGVEDAAQAVEALLAIDSYMGDVLLVIRDDAVAAIRGLVKE